MDVSPDVAAKMSEPMMGHRSKEYAELHGSLTSGLKKLLFTQNPVFISATSSTGWMEAAITNCVGRNSLHIVNGAFSSRWYKISMACGRQATKVDVEWGSAAKPADVEELVNSGGFDALFITHNETSTGAMTPLDGFGKLCHDNQMLLCVDAVSSAAGVKIETDKLGIDVLVTGTQKCFAVAPGLALTTVSQAALDRSKEMPGKGYYFDYHEYLKKDAKNNTPSTPPIPQIAALDYKVRKILTEEGLENRFKRHKELADYTRKWGMEKWELFTEDWCASNTVSCMKNTREYDLNDLKSKLSAAGYEFSNGYGDLKGKAFRVAHMGDRQMPDLKEYLEAIDSIVG
ncbi:MAG: alanine--glyoxylate aminotransferase family protein [Candidatus Altiarchaeota archaeon]